MSTKIRRQFTWQEWLDKCSTPPVDGWKKSGDDEWAGGTIKEALRMARYDGYSDAVPEAEAIAEHLVDTVAAQVSLDTFQAAYDVSGSEVDISRFTAGVPECMVESQPIKIARAGRAVRIVVPLQYHSGIGEKTVRQRGAAVMALVYVLQRLQHPLEVLGTFGYTSRGGQRAHYQLEIQRADEPTDIGRIMYALAHPTMLRRLAFRVQDHETARDRSEFGIPGYRGIPDQTRKDDLDDQAGTTIILPQLRDNGGWSVSESIHWIENQLEVIFADH